MRYRNPSQTKMPWRMRSIPRVQAATENRDKVYAAIIDYALEHGGNTPTLREIMDVTGISSTSVAAYNVGSLVTLGKLEILDRKLIVVGGTWIPPREGNK